MTGPLEELNHDQVSIWNNFFFKKKINLSPNSSSRLEFQINVGDI